MDIRKARDIAFQVGLGRSYNFTDDELRAAFHRLDKSQPEKRNKFIVRSDRRYAQVIWNAVGEKES